jgi:DNA-binding transcriptional ArsR family regulator
VRPLPPGNLNAVDDRHARNVARDRRRVWEALPSQMGWQAGLPADDVAQIVDLPPRLVSHHLHDLEGAGLANQAGGFWRQRGRWPQS